MTKYKLTDKAIKEKFYMLSDFTIERLNESINAYMERAEKDESLTISYFVVSLSKIVVAFKNPEMNKLYDAIASISFSICYDYLEEEHPKELKKITTGVWYDVFDIINDEYDIEEALEEAYDVIVCDLNSEEAGLDDNFTSNHRSYQVGYLDKDADDNYVLVSKCREQELGNFVRLMFIPAETEEE